jgi:hypothetical protein
MRVSRYVRARARRVRGVVLPWVRRVNDPPRVAPYPTYCDRSAGVHDTLVVRLSFPAPNHPCIPYTSGWSRPCASGGSSSGIYCIWGSLARCHARDDPLGSESGRCQPARCFVWVEITARSSVTRVRTCSSRADSVLVHT